LRSAQNIIQISIVFWKNAFCRSSSSVMCLEIYPAHFASTAGARSAFEPVAAGNTDIVDSSTPAAQHAAKSTSATHSHAGHRALAHVVRNSYENRNCGDNAIPAEPPSKSKAYGKRYHYPSHLLTYPVQTMFIGIVLLLSFPASAKCN
jgi:hypothetical protein